MHIVETIQKSKKFSKKLLTKGEESGRICKSLERAAKMEPCQKRVKKILKEILKKVLTSEKRCGIIDKLSTRGSDGH